MQRKPMIPTTPENLKRINSMLDALQDRVSYLTCRWMDEHEYEDIAEYGKVIAGDLPEGFTLLKMTKRPFGFHFSIGTEAVYAVISTSRKYGWKRIA